MNFQAGDVVRLKSGGPLMTITEVNGNVITCIWFIGDKEVEVKKFYDYTLFSEE